MFHEPWGCLVNWLVLVLVDHHVNPVNPFREPRYPNPKRIEKKERRGGGDISKRKGLNTKSNHWIDMRVLHKIQLCAGQESLGAGILDQQQISVGENPFDIFLMGKHLTTNWFACNLHCQTD